MVALALCAATTRDAAAEIVKPKVYILFDTSGSMLANTSNVFQNGDGSALCTGDGQNSRVYQLKTALFDALQGLGASEVDLALATFPMFVDPSRTPYCAIGKRNPCLSNADCVRPGETCKLLGLSPACVSPCESLPACSGHYYTTDQTVSENTFAETRYGCKVSTHQPKTQVSANCGDAANPCGPWYADYKTEVLKVPFGKPPEDVLLHFDGQEDHPLAANPEVRVGNGWWTPLGKSLFYAHGYFHKEVALPADDYRKPCERLVVAFFTDGGETCNPETSDAYYPTKWATQLKSNLGAAVHTVGIDSAGDSNTPLLAAIAAAGGGTFVQVASSTGELKKAFLDIIAKSLPPAELCNGIDDDCDGLIDEDFPLKGSPCDNGMLGACFRTGTYVCKADGSGVVCDAETPTPGVEICNGIDDDCNGEIDDIPGCLPCVPQPEICNGLDDNCNGEIDEGIPSVPCGKDVGECKAGTTACVEGKTICEGGVGPTEEICDGKDNDCDGVIDGMVAYCYPFDSGCDLETGVCQGKCKLGIQECTDGVWNACTGAVGPDPEICDGVDNNCDGQIDEDAECPGGSQCIEGACSAPCGTTEFGCPVGLVCKDNWCVRDTCDPVACAAEGGVCKGGACIDPCKDVQCAKFQKCDRGQCVDDSCYEARPCLAGERCVQGECEPDLCDKVTCGPDELCEGGTCLALCDEVTCPAGQRCQLVDEGSSKAVRCVADPCADTYCNVGLVCVEGKCVPDPCDAVSCERGEVCIVGKCLPDPCETIKCPIGRRCEAGACVTTVRSFTEVLATGAGGCSCLVGDRQGGGAGSSLAGALALLALLGLRRRGRRR